MTLPLDLIKCYEMTQYDKVSTEELSGAKKTTYLMCGWWVIGAVCCSNYYWASTVLMTLPLDLNKCCEMTLTCMNRIYRRKTE